MNLPGYITAYKDNDGYVYLYMFPGIYFDKHIYQYIDETKLSKFNKEILDDSSVKYKFINKNIHKITALLISNFPEKIKNKSVIIKL